MKPELWTTQRCEKGIAVVTDEGNLVGYAAGWPAAECIVAAHNAAIYRMAEELERVAWLAEANHEAWLAATGQNGGGGSTPHNPITGSNSRPAMRHSALGRD